MEIWKHPPKMPSPYIRPSWMFKDEHEIEICRRSVNNKAAQEKNTMTNKFRPNRLPNNLTADDEKELLCETAYRMRLHGKKMHLESSIISTAINYLKRFYIKHSLMEYHVEEISITCLYLAFKLENEFYDPLNAFLTLLPTSVMNMQKATKVIPSHEFFLRETLKHQLKVAHPFQPYDDFMNQLTETSHPVLLNSKSDFRGKVDIFFERVYYTVAVLIYSPSQIALAAIVDTSHYLADGGYVNTDQLIECLMTEEEKENDQLVSLSKAVQSIRKIVESYIDKPNNKIKPKFKLSNWLNLRTISKPIKKITETLLAY